MEIGAKFYIIKQSITDHEVSHPRFCHFKRRKATASIQPDAGSGVHDIIASAYTSNCSVAWWQLRKFCD